MFIRFLIMMALLSAVRVAHATPPGCPHAAHACCARCIKHCRHMPPCRPAPPPCPPRQRPKHVHGKAFAAPEEAPAAGAFVAPLSAGEVQGASRSFGIRGMEIEFPAWRLRLPTITLPSLFRSRADARMVVERAAAPFVAAAGAAVAPAAAAPQQVVAAPAQAQAFLAVPQAHYAPQQAAPQQAVPPQAAQPPCPDDAAEALEARAEAAARRLKQLEDAECRLEEKLRRLHEVLQQCTPPSPAGLPQPPPLSTPRHGPARDELPHPREPVPSSNADTAPGPVSPAHFQTAAPPAAPRRARKLPPVAPQ